MVLLAKKDAICTPDLTRPISLLDSFLKVQERLHLNRFIQVLKDRTILPDTQSGFQSGHRLQTCVLLLNEQILSYMSNSSPVDPLLQGKRSRWFAVCCGGSQGSSCTPILFITYHADMGDFVPMTMSFSFSDNLAAVIIGQIGIRYTDQCINLERRRRCFFDH